MVVPHAVELDGMPDWSARTETISGGVRLTVVARKPEAAIGGGMTGKEEERGQRCNEAGGYETGIAGGSPTHIPCLCSD